MNVYDFDGTIYDGDSSIDFFVFCCKKNWKSIWILPGFAISVLRYKFRKCTKEQMKSSYFRFVRCFDQIDWVIDAFWLENSHKMKAFYKKSHREDDIIISASPDFLLKPMVEKMHVQLLASQVDPQTGQFLGKNCSGEEKVRRLHEASDESIEEFYSDSLSDAPLSRLAKRSFLVKKDNIIPWPQEKGLYK